MRFIGNKENLVGNIHRILESQNIKGDSFFDFFAGTTNVGKFFKKLDYQVFSSDLLYFSYVLQKAYIENNREPEFTELLKNIEINSVGLFSTPLESVVEYLNTVAPQEDFIYRNYTPAGSADLEKPRMFFTGENGRIIDAIRRQIENWRGANLINESEYFILLACLIESVPFYANISGVYAAFQKKWDPRAVKKLTLKPVSLVFNNRENKAFNENSVDLIAEIEADILYLDPPYNHRQYAPNYHLLETIARYDNPEIKGVAGLRNYENQKSKFCNKDTGLEELRKIAENARYRNLILSYNSEGVMPQERILKTLQEFGETELIEFNYLRFKSNSNGDSRHKKFIKEQLYILRKK